MIIATRQRRIREPERELLYAAKHRARVKNLPFDIDLKDINITEFCPLLGKKLQKGIGKLSELSPTLDRIIPNLGYVKGNVWVISHRANMIKNCSTIEELELIVKNLKERKTK